MPSRKSYSALMLIFSLLGFLFSGYLSYSKIILGSCPLTEGCPTFLSYPACVFGLGFFTILLILSIMLIRLKDSRILVKSILVISFLAVIFAAYSTYKEYAFPSCLGDICDYSLLVPTCVYGLVMYIIIFILSLLAFKKK